MKYFLSQNTIPKEHIDKLSDWLKEYKRLTQSELVKQFEDKWSERFSTPYSVFCNSGSSANLLAFSALKEYDACNNKKTKVAICVAGWSTTLSPLMQLGIPYVFIDIDKNTFGMDLAHLENKLISEGDITAVVLVHTLGCPNNMSAIAALKKKYNLTIIEDSCPAVGSKYNDRYVGTFGDIGTYSFYYGHQISTIEGGMIVTSNPDIKDLVYMMRNHGWSADLSDAKRQELEAKYSIPEHMRRFTFYVPGYNVRGTELNAFLGLLQLEVLDRYANARDDNFWHYKTLLGRKFVTQLPPAVSKVSSITFPAMCETEAQRIEVYNILSKNGVETRPISGGNLGQQPYTNVKFISEFSNRLHTCGFVLPCHPEIYRADVEFISNLIL